MDMELMQIQLTQDFEELAEQYEGAADNELLWALGAPTAEATKMHTLNVVHNREMAKLYKALAERVPTVLASLEVPV